MRSLRFARPRLFAAPLLGLTLGLLMPPAETSAGIHPEGMAGTGHAFATGVGAAITNPALLSFEAERGWSVQFLELGAGVGNNAIGSALYNRANGERLDDRTRQELLAAIPESGLAGHGGLRVQGLGLQVGRFAVASSGWAEASTTLPKDAFSLLLLGNAELDSISLNDARGEALALADIRIAGAAPFHISAGELSVGLGLRMLQSFGYASLEGSEGMLHSDESGMHGQAEATLLSATGGSGQALDIGLALERPGNWRFGLALENAIARLTMDRGAEKRIFRAQLDTLSASSFEDGNDADYYSTEETVESLDQLEVRLPKILRASAGVRHGRWGLAADFEHRMGRGPLADRAPRVALGTELRAAGWLPLRLGLAFGGATGQEAAAGLGLHFAKVRIDVAARIQGSFSPGDPKGVGFAFGIGLGD